MKRLILTLLFSLVSQQAFAQYYYGGYFYDREYNGPSGSSKKWTLQDFLKGRRTRNMWFASNSKPPYEVMWGVAYKSTLVRAATESQNTSPYGYLTLHAPIIGLTFEHENNTQENFNDITGMLNFRIFGNSIQNTYLTIHGGQRTRTYSSAVPDSVYKNQFWQLSLQFYLTKYFGIDGFYRSYIPNTETLLNQEISGSLAEYGVFIDFRTTRIFGTWYNDTETIQSTVAPFDTATTNRIGTKAGIKFYF
jgi:hypothetical protein